MAVIMTKAEFDRLDPSDQWLIVANPPVVVEVGQSAPIALPPAPEAVVFSGELEGEAIVITQPLPDFD